MELTQNTQREPEVSISAKDITSGIMTDELHNLKSQVANINRQKADLDDRLAQFELRKVNRQ
jgi:hypothetical protein